MEKQIVAITPKEQKQFIEFQKNREIAKDLKKSLQLYLRAGTITDFTQFQFIEKLALVQSTPKDKIRKRKIGGKKNEKTQQWEDSYVEYLPHQYCQRVLNVIFNFCISSEVVKEEYVTYTLEKERSVETGYDAELKKKTYKKEKYTAVVTEAEATVKFTFLHPETNREIVRTVKGSHKIYQNEATTRGMGMQAAISKSWTAVAKTFGIGADLNDADALTEMDEKIMSMIEADVVIDDDVITSTKVGF